MTTSPPPEGAGASPKRQAVFFDLDKTVIAKAAMSAFRGPFYDGGLLTKRSLVRALFAQLIYLHLGASDLRLSRMREVLLKVTRGWDRSQVAAIVDETLEGIIEPIIYAEAMDLIEQHRADGRIVAIVSASPEELVIPLGRHLGVHEVIASRAEVDERDCYTGAMAFYAYGPYKAEAIREFAARNDVDLGASYAYSDSYTDLPMLEVVGHPVAVNPDRVLANLAKDRGWEVLRFVRPVRLRDRVRERVPLRASRPAVALSTAAAVVSVGVASAGWWLGNRVLRRRRASPQGPPIRPAPGTRG